MEKALIDKKKLVAKLPIDEEKFLSGEDLALEHMSLARSLLKLANIDEDSVFQLCRSVAGRLLDKVPEPDEIELLDMNTDDDMEANRSKSKE